MNNTTKWILGLVGALLLGGTLVVSGIFIGRGLAFRQVADSGFYGLMGGPGMMSQYAGEEYGYGYGPGMMGGRGMMGGTYGEDAEGYPTGMMGPGMMGSNSGLVDVDPLSVEEAEETINDFLGETGSDDLELHEIMIFEDNAYGIIVEESTSVGAMEVLVDHATGTVYPEPGPNMMWNTKYGHHAGGFGGMMGGMMGGRGMMGRGYSQQALPDVSAEMPVSEDEAVTVAQAYLDDALPGTEADEHADAFYGYYTLHVLRDGEIVGMLSVNGYSGEVWPHTWHGDFIEMAAH